MRAFALSADAVAAAADGSEHALAPLDEDERAGLARDLPQDAPAHVAGDFPEWLAPSFERAFGGAGGRGRRGAQRARARRSAGQHAQVHAREGPEGAGALCAEPTPLSPAGVRVPAPEGAGRAPHLEAEAAHGKGWFEVQDEGSQMAALLAGAGPRMQVLDLCAGAGGKTLALAAAMQNTGQIYAYDADKRQLRPIFERLKRAGARNVQVMDAGDEAALLALGPRFDVVLVDAPCTGSGTWRRKPDSKWRLKPANIPERQAEQRDALELGAKLVKPGGSPGLRHLLGAAGGKRRPGRGVPRRASRLRASALCGAPGASASAASRPTRRTGAGHAAARLPPVTAPTASSSRSCAGKMLKRSTTRGKGVGGKLQDGTCKVTKEK